MSYQEIQGFTRDPVTGALLVTGVGGGGGGAETDPVAGPALATHSALTTDAHGGLIVPPGTTTGRWFTTAGGNSAVAAGNEGVAHFNLVYISNKVDALACEVTTVGTTGSLLRLGLATDNGAGLPSTTIVDAGTVDGTTLGVKQAVFGSVYIPPKPAWYWLIVVEQGGATTRATMRCIGTGHAFGITSQVAAATGIYSGLVTAETTTTGALPTSWTGYTFNLGTTVIRVQARVG